MTWPPPFGLRNGSPHQRACDQELPIQPPSTAELVVLCSFGLRHGSERSGSDLRRALVEAGYAPAEARAFLRTSPLVERTSRTGYRLTALGSGH